MEQSVSVGLDQCFTRTMTVFDAQIAVALFATFLLGVAAGSGMEIIVKGRRHLIPVLISESADVAMLLLPGGAGPPAGRTHGRATSAFQTVFVDRAMSQYARRYNLSAPEGAAALARSSGPGL